MDGEYRSGVVIGETESICPECLKVIAAKKVVKEDGIYLEKTCGEHGTYSTLIWEGTQKSYEAWGSDIKPSDQIPKARAAEKGCPYDCGLCEAHERRGCCVLLEVTSRCNLHCPVCFAGAGEAGSKDVPLAELAEQMDDLMAHGGPFNLQLSGGEPTMRDDLPELIHIGREKGFSFFQLNTNGLRLAREKGYAKTLKDAGLSCVFLQFDGVEDGVYQVLRGQALWEQKKTAIDACEDAGLGVILVPVITPGVNEDQVGAILNYARSRMPVVRGVHFQPISYFGRCLEAQGSYRITIPKMLKLMEEQTDDWIESTHFTGGNATNPYCTFQANYLRQADGTMKPMIHGTARAYATSEQAREFVARQWVGPDDGGACCCSAEAETSKVNDCCQTETQAQTCCCGIEQEAVKSGEECCCITETQKVNDCCQVEIPSEACCCNAAQEVSESGNGRCCTTVQETTESDSECCCMTAQETTENGSECCCATAPESGSECCCNSEQGASDGGCCCGEDTAQMQLDTSSLDEFLANLHNNTFAISGMLFQDACNLDLERLRRCYILETDSRYHMVPFCAYNLTSLKGRTLYR